MAIFHDYFGAIGGGERVVIAIAKILNADIITTDTDSIQKIDPSVHVISLGRTIKYPGIKQISALLKFYFCDFSREYDLFIFSGNWAHYTAHRHHPNLWYCHTPVRAFYDNYSTFSRSLPVIQRVLFQGCVSIFRFVDRWSILHVDQIIANSNTTKKRILHFFNRESEVIYPPVDTKRFYFAESGNFWLSVNRLYPEKRIELQIESFRDMHEQKLMIAVGLAQGDHAGAYVKKIMTNIPPNITFLGEVEEKDLIDLFAHCKGLICTAEDEDFGITPLEAMASGKPVVAVNEGGFRETITEETGILVMPETKSIISAIIHVSKNTGYYYYACINRAKEFDQKKFLERLGLIIDNYRQRIS